METNAASVAEVAPVIVTSQMEPRPSIRSRANKRDVSNGALFGAAAGGAAAIGLAAVSSVLMRLVRRKGKKHTAIRSASASPARVAPKTTSKTAAFGSPSSVSVSPIPAIKFDLDLDPKAQQKAVAKDQTSKPTSISLAPAVAGLENDLAPVSLPPGSMSKHLALLTEAQEENKKLRRFLETHSQSSDRNQDKLSKLEKENQDLRACMQKLEAQLKEVAARAPAPASAPSSGEELALLKEKLSSSAKLLNIKAAQSVCSEADDQSVGGFSVVDAHQRKKISTLSQLLGWSTSTSSTGGGLMSLFPKSPTPSRPVSQPSTPRGTRSMEPTVPPAQVIKMLDAAFSGGGAQGNRIMF